MNKTEFIRELNRLHKEDVRDSTEDFIAVVTRLGIHLSKDIVKSTWGCSNPKYFGHNVYNLLESSANEDNSVTFEPKLKKGCQIYYNHLDMHTAAFALYKIKQFKLPKLNECTTCVTPSFDKDLAHITNSSTVSSTL